MNCRGFRRLHLASADGARGPSGHPAPPGRCGSRFPPLLCKLAGAQSLSRRPESEEGCPGEESSLCIRRHRRHADGRRGASRQQRRKGTLEDRLGAASQPGNPQVGCTSHVTWNGTFRGIRLRFLLHAERLSFMRRYRLYAWLGPCGYRMAAPHLFGPNSGTPQAGAAVEHSGQPNQGMTSTRRLFDGIESAVMLGSARCGSRWS